jgi:TRAP-type C4-dicarboxylate transport system permease small subunit
VSTAALLFFFAFLALRYAFGTVRELGSRSPVLGIPLYLVYLAAPLGFALAGLQHVLAVVKNLRSEGVWLSYEAEEDHDVPPEGI